MKSKAPVYKGFQSAVSNLTASGDEYEAEGHWDLIKANINFSDPKQVQQWLDLQKMILTNSTAVYGQESLQRSAIQEFYTLFEHARPYEAWLTECKQRSVFRDPFLVQNLDMILDVLDKTKAPGD
jgi:hypothetical protein